MPISLRLAFFRTGGNGSVSISENNQVKAETILSVYPNPAGAKVDIGYNNNAEGYMHLAIYDIQGKRVRDIVSKPIDKGQYSEWISSGNFNTMIIFVLNQTFI